MSRHIVVYNTPEAKAAGTDSEYFRVLEQTPSGVLCDKGREGKLIYLPWEYLRQYQYHFMWKGQRK